MRIPCDTNPLRGICSDIKAQQAQIDSLLSEGAVDLSGLALADHEHDPLDLSGYATDAELTDGLATKADTTHTHTGSGGQLIYRQTLRGQAAYNTQISQNTSEEINNFFIYWTATAGCTVELDWCFTIYQYSVSQTDIKIRPEVGGVEHFAGQLYETNNAQRCYLVTGKKVWTGLSGYSQARIIVQCDKGSVYISDDALRPVEMTIKEWSPI